MPFLPTSEFSWQHNPHCWKRALRKTPRRLGRRTCLLPLLVRPPKIALIKSCRLTSWSIKPASWFVKSVFWFIKTSSWFKKLASWFTKPASWFMKTASWLMKTASWITKHRNWHTWYGLEVISMQEAWFSTQTNWSRFSSLVQCETQIVHRNP